MTDALNLSDRNVAGNYTGDDADTLKFSRVAADSDELATVERTTRVRRISRRRQLYTLVVSLPALLLALHLLGPSCKAFLRALRPPLSSQ